MVEAPRIRIIYENVEFTRGKKIVRASGASYRKIGIDLENYVIWDWWYAGKYIYTKLLRDDYPPYTIRTHTMMYGRITTTESTHPRLVPFLKLELDDGTILVWYLCQVKILDPNCTTDELKTNYHVCTSKQAIEDSKRLMKYDISNPAFDANLFRKHLHEGMKKHGDEIIVDYLLNQEYFPGVGNILQQEALYRCRINPYMLVNDVAIDGLDCLTDALREVINALYNSYLSKKEGKPRHAILQIYHKSRCPLDHKTTTKNLGYHDRRTTWCPICQKIDDKNTST